MPDVARNAVITAASNHGRARFCSTQGGTLCTIEPAGDVARGITTQPSPAATAHQLPARSLSQLGELGLKQYLDGSTTNATSTGLKDLMARQQHLRILAAPPSSTASASLAHSSYNYVGLQDKRKLFQSAYERVWLKEQRE